MIYIEDLTNTKLNVLDAENERDDLKPKENPECEIKIEIPDWKNAVIIDHKNDMNIAGCVENSETEHVDSLGVNIMETQVYPATDDVKRVDVKEAVCVEPGVKNCVKSIDKLIPKMKTSKRVKKGKFSLKISFIIRKYHLLLENIIYY